MLLENASEAGVEVCQGANVRDVLFEGGRAVGVRVELAGGSITEITASVVVDASGQRSFIARKLGLHIVDPKLRHASIFARYRGAVRGEGIDEGATLIFWTEEQKSWFWFIPLPGDLESVGVVAPVDYLVKGRTSNPQAVFEEELSHLFDVTRIDAAEVGVLQPLDGLDVHQSLNVLAKFFNTSL